MVRVTCLSPTKSYSYCSSAFAHLEILILQTSNNDPSTRNNQRATIQSKQQVQLRTIHQYKTKALKERKARCYDYKSARKAKNGTKVEKIQ